MVPRKPHYTIHANRRTLPLVFLLGISKTLCHCTFAVGTGGEWAFFLGPSFPKCANHAFVPRTELVYLNNHRRVSKDRLQTVARNRNIYIRPRNHLVLLSAHNASSTVSLQLFQDLYSCFSIGMKLMVRRIITPLCEKYFNIALWRPVALLYLPRLRFVHAIEVRGVYWVKIVE